VLCLRIRLADSLDYLALRQTLSDTSIVSLPFFDARINPTTVLEVWLINSINIKGKVHEIFDSRFFFI
jgi:hypothetical protein